MFFFCQGAMLIRLIKKPCMLTRNCPKSYSHRANSNYPLIHNYLWFNIHLSILCSEQYFFVVRSVHHHHLPVPVCGHVWRRRSRSHTVVVRTLHGHQGEEVHGQEVRKWSKTSLSEVFYQRSTVLRLFSLRLILSSLERRQYSFG